MGSKWLPIELAPDGKLCIVGWIDPEDGEERHDFDYMEEGYWVNYGDWVEHAEAVAPAGSRMPTREAPYQWFIAIPPMKTKQASTPGGDDEHR